MDFNDIDYEQLIIDLENGTFVPTANEGAPQPLYTPYSCWDEMLAMDECAYDEVSRQYLEFIKSRQDS